MPGCRSNPYLSQGDCATLGYTKAVGSEVKPWAPVAMMNNIAKSYSCDCTFPDCPDVSKLFLVCVCVCVCEEREKVCVCARERERERGITDVGV